MVETPDHQKRNIFVSNGHAYCEASTLKKPQPWPRILRGFEAEGQIFLHFRGPIEAEGSLKVQGFFEGVPRRTLKL